MWKSSQHSTKEVTFHSFQRELWVSHSGPPLRSCSGEKEALLESTSLIARLQVPQTFVFLGSPCSTLSDAMNRAPNIVVTAPLAFHKTQMQGISLSLSPANLSSFLTLLDGYHRLFLAFFKSEIKYRVWGFSLGKGVFLLRSKRREEI